MRFLILIAILFAFLVPVKPHATEQIPNYLIYKGKTYPLGFENDDILYLYLQKHGKWKWLGDSKKWCTALARGYYTTFEVVNNELVLKNIENCSDVFANIGGSSNKLLKKFLSELEIKDSVLKADWFTGQIVIAVDKPLYEDIHEYYSVLYFEKGILIKEVRIDYKKYLNNKLKDILENVMKNPDKEIRTILKKTFEEEYQSDLEDAEHYLETEKGAKSEFLAKLKTEYERKSKKTISDFELAIQEIRFSSEYRIETIRILNGVRITYYRENPPEFIKVRLSLEEWLYFINALSNCCFDKWKKPSPSRYNSSYSKGNVFVCSSNKDKYKGECYEFPTKEANLPNLEEFKKIMEDFVAKIRKAGGK